LRVRVIASGTIDIAKNLDKLGREGLEMDTCAQFGSKKAPKGRLDAVKSPISNRYTRNIRNRANLLKQKDGIDF
jgi:hypothetical protein